ncbi:EAL domain-containing protein [Gallaecimonas mangrovi]|uniref:EAL domain-containing protein n=1 Tax=Gallaecimonas mangrovi TaxID=2291597 RepID=UPI000E205897|nr:EAL domain-containing protein [Gallaecimonas mangrovi]
MHQSAKILVVDDEAIIAMDVAEQLEEFGYQVVGIAHSGEQAIKLIKEMQPDLVLMDIVLGAGIDGIQTAAKAKQDANIPFIFLSAFSDLETVTRAANTAPYGYLTKPYQANELRAAIEVALTKVQLEQALVESEAWFSNILKAVDDGIIAVAPDCGVSFTNPTASKMLALDSKDIKAQKAQQLFSLSPSANADHALHPLEQAMKLDQVLPIVFGGYLSCVSGVKMRVDYTAAPIRGNNGDNRGAVMVLRDAGPRLAMEAALKNSEERFQQAFMHSAVGLALVTMDGRVMQTNPAFEGLLQVRKEDNVHLSRYLVSNLDRDQLTGKLHQLLGGRVPAVQMEMRFKNPKGGVKWMLTTISLIHDEHAEPCYFIYQLNDLTERKEVELELHQLANFDDLTGLMNRPKLLKELNQLIVSSAINDESFAVVFIDLDHFKDINDSLGHAIGDKLLAEVARSMHSGTRSSDILARLGGDEFVVLVPHIRGPETVQRVANILVKRLSQPFDIDGKELQIGASVGISMFPTDGDNSELLLQHADAALYTAKTEGRGLVRFYDPTITQQLNKRLAMESALRHAMEDGELYLHYQPIAALPDLNVIGVEALLRWQYKGQQISPCDFIPLAEKTQLINPIGSWVLEQSCKEVKQWHKAGHRLSLSVNVSPVQFRDPRFLEQVSLALEYSGLESRYLVLEITESALSDPKLALTVMASLKALGVGVAVDDFGTGYSSLSYLKLYSPHILKIDQSFVRDLEKDSNDAAIVNATIAMGKQLGMKIVAEGVETEGQLQHLLQQKCDRVQGYLLGKPMSGNDLLSSLL